MFLKSNFKNLDNWKLIYWNWLSYPNLFHISSLVSKQQEEVKMFWTNE